MNHYRALLTLVLFKNVKNLVVWLYIHVHLTGKVASTVFCS